MSEEDGKVIDCLVLQAVEPKQQEIKAPVTPGSFKTKCFACNGQVWMHPLAMLYIARHRLVGVCTDCYYDASQKGGVKQDEIIAIPRGQRWTTPN